MSFSSELKVIPRSTGSPENTHHSTKLAARTGERSLIIHAAGSPVAKVSMPVM